MKSWGCCREGLYWIRWRGTGWGVYIVDRTRHRPLFSVRLGYTPELRIGRWGLRILRPVIEKVVAPPCRCPSFQCGTVDHQPFCVYCTDTYEESHRRMNP